MGAMSGYVSRESILLVDDDARVLDTYKTILGNDSDSSEWEQELKGLIDLEPSVADPATESDRHYKLIIASSGMEAVRKHAEALSQGEIVPVALVDMRMPPGISGLETAIKLRKQDPTIYIVVITAYTDYPIDEIQQALQHDFILLTKPASADELYQITRNAVISYQRYLDIKQTQSFLGTPEAEEGCGKVLVADGDPVVQQYVSTLLSNQGGYQVYLSHNGGHVLERVAEIEPDLVLLGEHIPEVYGVDICRHIKMMPSMSSIPVIFTVDLKTDKGIDWVFQAGGADYVPKPITSQVLLARVAIHLNHYREIRRREQLSRNQLLKVMHSLNEGMIITDRFGKVTEVNQVVERMTRMTSEALTGKAVSSMFVEGRKGREQFSFDVERLQAVQQRIQRLQEQRPHYFKQLIDDAPICCILAEAESRQVTAVNYRTQQVLKVGESALKGSGLDRLIADLPEPFSDDPQELVSTLTIPAADEYDKTETVQVALIPFEKEDSRYQMVLIRQDHDQLDWELVRLTAFGQLLRPESHSSQRELIQQGGGSFPVLLQGGVFRDDSHHIEGGVLTLVDLRDIRLAESKQQYAAFQAGVAEMSATLLHTIGNSIQGINNGVSQLRQQMRVYLKLVSTIERFNKQTWDDAEERNRRLDELMQVLPTTMRELIGEGENRYSDLSALGMVKQGADYIAEIVELHRKGFKMDQQATQTNVRNLLDDVLMLTRESAQKRRIALETELTLEETSFMLPRNQLMQALINLVTNAVDAVDERFKGESGGEIMIRAFRGPFDQVDCLRILVVDNGIGISEEQQCKLFTFGYSTKRRGSGFGLHATANFLRSINGRVLVDSDGPDTGATVTLTIPIMDQ